MCFDASERFFFTAARPRLLWKEFFVEFCLTCNYSAFCNIAVGTMFGYSSQRPRVFEMHQASWFLIPSVSCHVGVKYCTESLELELAFRKTLPLWHQLFWQGVYCRCWFAPNCWLEDCCEVFLALCNGLVFWKHDDTLSFFNVSSDNKSSNSAVIYLITLSKKLRFSW